MELTKNKEVARMIEVIQNEKGIEIDKEGVGTLKEGVLDKMLPEGITTETLEANQKAQANAVSAIALVFGSQSKSVFDKAKDLEKATLEADLYKGSRLAINQKRVSEYRVVGDPDGKKVTKYGQMKITLDQKSPVSEKSINRKMQELWEGVSN